MPYIDDDNDGEKDNNYIDNNTNAFSNVSSENNITEEIANHDPQIKPLDYGSKNIITNSYFCFKCGAIMTTKEDKKQHEYFELNKLKRQDMESTQ